MMLRLFFFSLEISNKEIKHILKEMVNINRNDWFNKFDDALGCFQNCNWDEFLSVGVWEDLSSSDEA